MQGISIPDPLRTLLWLGHMADKVPDPIGTKRHKSDPRHRFLCLRCKDLQPSASSPRWVGKCFVWGTAVALQQDSAEAAMIAWLGLEHRPPAAPYPGGERPGKRAHLGLSLAKHARVFTRWRWPAAERLLLNSRRGGPQNSLNTFRTLQNAVNTHNHAKLRVAFEPVADG